MDSLKAYVVSFCLFTLIKSGQSLCAFQCSWQNKTFNITGGSFSGGYLKYFTTKVHFFFGGELISIAECYARSGPFHTERVAVNETHNGYFCLKDMNLDPNDSALLYYLSAFTILEGNPTICDICTGSNLNDFVLDIEETDCAVVKVPELGCNIPVVCPVTKKGQIRCTGCEPSDSNDDGLGCA